MSLVEQSFLDTWSVQPNKQKRKGNQISWLASDCAAPSLRNNFVRALNRYIGVDRSGSCLHNVAQSPPTGANENVVASYRFYLSIENSNCKDYITEKLERAFQYGVVPVVDGAPRADYEPFIPNHDSIIHVDDFDSIEDLANYLKSLLKEDDVYYSRHLAYRWNASLITNRELRINPFNDTGFRWMKSLDLFVRCATWHTI